MLIEGADILLVFLAAQHSVPITIYTPKATGPPPSRHGVFLHVLAGAANKPTAMFVAVAVALPS